MIDLSGLNVRVEPMTVADLEQVLNIERLAFSSPWSVRAYEYELRYNEMARYFVARLDTTPSNGSANGHGILGRLKRWFAPEPPAQPQPTPQMIGYVGYWLMAGEAHISQIAVHPELRARSYGELLLAFALRDAAKRSAHVATLEVRVSNHNAQQLYVKYGFEKVGMRKAYYSDNNEDAFIMTTPTLNSAAYQQKFERLTNALQQRLEQNAASALPRAV